MKNISIYLCGPTLYRETHLGNYRGLIFFNSYVSLLRSFGFDVRYISNVTDLGEEDGDGQDKVVSASAKEDIYYFVQENWFHYSHRINLLDIIRPEFFNASDFVDGQKDLVRTAVEKSNCSITEDGIYAEGFERLLPSQKENFLDLGKRLGKFAIWRFNNSSFAFEFKDYKKGLPGWHIECYSIIKSVLKTFPITVHAGGVDLRDIHHNCEIYHRYMDSGCFDLSKHWLHFGNITLNGKKMSKSLNNGVDIKYIVNKYGSSFIKVMFNTVKPKSDISVSSENMEQFKNVYNGFIDKILSLVLKRFNVYSQHHLLEVLENINKCCDNSELLAEIREKFCKDMFSFNISSFFLQMLNSHNLDEILVLDKLLRSGVLNHIIKALKSSLRFEYIVRKRETYRAEGNFSKSDEIRDFLIKNNIKLIDNIKNTIFYEYL